MSGLRQPVQRLGHSVIERIVRLGFAARFFAYMLVHSGTALRRFHLTIREIYFAGVLSLIIILVSGMFVGMVLALQGYETLQRYGSSEALGVVARLIRRLNDSLGATSIVVTHDVAETLPFVDHVFFMADGRVVAEGPPGEVERADVPFVTQFVQGNVDGAVPFHFPAPGYRADLGLEAKA